MLSTKQIRVEIYKCSFDIIKVLSDIIIREDQICDSTPIPSIGYGFKEIGGTLVSKR